MEGFAIIVHVSDPNQKFLLKTGSHSVAQVALELIIWPQVCLELMVLFFLSLPTDGIIGIKHHAWFLADLLNSLFLKC